jgi:hypothetical protein
MVTMTLDELLIAAHVPRFQRRMWFQDARYANNQIVTSDEAAAGIITRCYLEALRQVAPVSGVTVVTVEPEPQKPVSAFKKKAWHGELPPTPKAGALW